MLRLATRPGVLLQAWLLCGIALAGDTPSPTREAINIRETQVTLAIEQHGISRSFRGSVLAMRDNALTILTAASFVDGDEEGCPAQLLLDAGSIPGVVMSVARNPGYQPDASFDDSLGRTTSVNQHMTSFRSLSRARYHYSYRRHLAAPESNGVLHREVPVADNAIVRCWFPTRSGPNEKPTDVAFRAIRPVASLTEHVCPEVSEGVLTARIVDGKGMEHVIRAGTFQNPRLLEWGHAYNPKRLDIGAGVFTYRPGPDGQPELTLIGVLLGPDLRGGSASLVCRGMPWVAEALRDSKARPASVEDSRLNAVPPAR